MTWNSSLAGYRQYTCRASHVEHLATYAACAGSSARRSGWALRSQVTAQRCPMQTQGCWAVADFSTIDPHRMTSTSPPAIGFLTAMEHAEHGLFGGYLLLN